MNLTDPIFIDADKARSYLEALQWAGGRNCPHCGTVDNSVKLEGKSTRPGVYKCRDCRKPFSVTVGTLFERSHVPLNKWLLAVFTICGSKKGVSSHQLMRSLDVTYKTAWFMSHRIREAMRDGTPFPMGGMGTPVEVDETFIGREPGMPVRSGFNHKMKVLTLIDRETKTARSMVINDIKASTIGPIVMANVAREAALMTDEAHRFQSIGRHFASHETVNHARDEYVRYATPTITTNTVENYFSVFKRGMKGIYQHCAKHHLHRYLAEFDFRYSNRSANGVDDTQRTRIALSMIVGKRLTYRRINEFAQAAA